TCTPMSVEERRGLLYVALAVVFFSTSPLFIVWADPMSPFVKTWGRMTVAAVLVGLAAWVEGRRRRGKQSGWPPGGMPEIPGIEPPAAEGAPPPESRLGAPRPFLRFAAPPASRARARSPTGGLPPPHSRLPPPAE